jgi:PAS domain S-box-containing protein
LLDVAHLPALSPLDLSVFVVVMPWTTYAIAMFGFHILDPLPAARQTVIEQMHAGVVAFDARWQVVSLNPAAEGILGVRAGVAHGKTWQQLAASQPLLPALPDASTQRAGAATEDSEMTFGSGSNARQYASALSPLRDPRGLLMGYMLMLRDVTEQRRAQAQIVEHERKLATLHERERLARELHDSIGQVLGYASFQVEADGQLIDDGQTPVARAQLARLGGVLIDAHADVRQQILDLRVAPSVQQPFFAAVQHYLDGFTSNYDIQTNLTVGGGPAEDGFSPEAQTQLYRILQEALANARKHSGARRVQVTFETVDGTARMSIKDDGRGFDPDGFDLGRAAVAGDDHFGLGLMRERAEELDGSLRVESAPGQGTSVVVEVPRVER